MQLLLDHGTAEPCRQLTVGMRYADETTVALKTLVDTAYVQCTCNAVSHTAYILAVPTLQVPASPAAVLSS